MNRTDDEIVQTLAGLGHAAPPSEILASLFLPQGKRQWLHNRLKTLVNAGRILHDREASTYLVPINADLEAEILQALAARPLQRQKLVSTFVARGAGSSEVEQAIKRLGWRNALEPVAGVERWKELPADGDYLWLTPQEWTRRGICYVCMDALEDGPAILAADRRGFGGAGHTAVHVRCHIDPLDARRCTECGLDLVPSEEPDVLPVTAWEILDHLDRRDWLILVPILHRVGEAADKTGGYEPIPIESDRRMPSPEEVLPKAFPDKKLAGDAPGDGQMRSMLLEWCLVRLENMESARNLDAVLEYFGSDGTAYPGGRFNHINAVAQGIRANRLDRYWLAFQNLLGPAAASRNNLPPDWYLRQAGKLRAGGTSGLDDRVFSRPVQALVRYHKGRPYHPYCHQSASAGSPASPPRASIEHTGAGQARPLQSGRTSGDRAAPNRAAPQRIKEVNVTSKTTTPPPNGPSQTGNKSGGGRGNNSPKGK